MFEDLKTSYNLSHGIDMNYKIFSLVLKDDTYQTVGVLSFYTIFSEIFIDMIWVQEKCRRKGLGKMLVQELENRFLDQGFNNINLCTYDFQMPEFYRECGFELEFTRKNEQNPQFTKYFFVKFFENDIQKQGLI
jgi:ribosomal protein S18 acetylase RimI-like enzyme